jgi:sigma-E factor negative regulatory protein RseB
MKYWLWLLVIPVCPVWASDYLPESEAAAWLQRISDAARSVPYEGIFVMQMGDRMQTVQVENHPSGSSSETRLVLLDGKPREVRCTRTESVILAWNAQGQQLQRRIGNRHFPDLLPENATNLVKYYKLKPGEMVRVAGQDCRIMELVPKDEYRWGYRLCAEQYTGLPLKADMLNESGKPLLQYVFVKVREGISGHSTQMKQVKMPAEHLVSVADSPVVVHKLPPGYSQLIAVKRTLPSRDVEVEHRIYSDGLNHISMFVEPAPEHMVSVKGQSARGFVNLLTRKVGDYQVTVLGDAPSAAVDLVARNVAVSDKP